MKKIKLINRITLEEILCMEVISDGYKYYGNFGIDENANIVAAIDGSGIGEIIERDETYAIVKFIGEHNKKGSINCIHDRESWISVIATNNSINLPQIEDEVEELAKSFVDRNTGSMVSSVRKKYEFFFKEGYNEHAKTNPNSNEDSMAFADWCADNDWVKYKGIDRWKYTLGNYPLKRPMITEELFELFEKEQVKTIYYSKWEK